MKPLITLLFVTIGCTGTNGPKILDDTGETPGSLLVDTEAVAFGLAEDVGLTQQAAISLQNTGQGEVSINSIVFEGPFSASLEALSVPPLGTVSLGLYFLPVDYADATGAMTLQTDDPDNPAVIVSLSGGVIVDGDADGYDRVEAGGEDCDDTDPNTFPGATETWYDGNDQDCGGDDDYDQDGDGYQTVVFNEDTENGGGDCNDVVDWVHPGATDDWYDGVDSNCDGQSDWDADGDGYSSEALNKGSDCNDFDVDVHPGASERLNGQVDGCDGDQDAEILASSADYIYTGVGSNERLGYGLGAGDIDGDGLPDLVTGAPDYNTAGGLMGRGAAAVFLSTNPLPASGSNHQSGFHLFQGTGATSGLGFSVSVVDDFNGNSQADLLVGAPGDNSYGGAIYIIDSSAVLVWGGTQNRHTEIRGGSGGGYYVGRGIAGQADLDGDSLSDVIFEYSTSSSTSGSGNLGLLYGGANNIVDLSSVDVLMSVGTSSSHPTRQNLATAMDIDGDGYQDWVYGNSGDDSQGTNTGAVWVIWGQAAQHSNVSVNPVLTQVVAGDSGKGAGYMTALLPDIDGDSSPDLAWWLETEDELHLLSGAGLRDGGVQAATDSFAVITFASGSIPGQIGSIGDWDDDGADEWIVTLDGEDGSGAGDSYVFWGAGMSGDYDVEDDFLASFEPHSDDSNVDFGHRIIAGGADIDGDGRPDLVASDPLYEGDLDGDGTADEEVGAVYLFLNQGL